MKSVVLSTILTTIVLSMNDSHTKRRLQQQTEFKKPNILMMVVDDIGWSDISYGDHNAEYNTSNIDDLFRTGIELQNYYVHETCSPTRSAILTGQYAFKNGLQYIDTIPPGTTEHIPFENPTIMEILKGLGYRNEMIGKWHLGYASWNMTPTGRGFDNHYGFFQDAQDYYTHITISPKPVEREDFPKGFDFFDNRNVANESAINSTYGADLFYDRFEKVITNYAMSGDPSPLFMYMAFQTVHTPIEYPSVNFTDKCSHILNPNRTIYCLKVVYMDYIIGKMIDLYKNYSLWDDTLFILTTDNGGMVTWSNNSRFDGGVAISYGCNMPYRGGKATLWEGGLKAVGVINGGKNIIPEHIRGQPSKTLIHAIDWLPTIIEGLIQSKVSKEIILPDVDFDGNNLWPELMGLLPDDPNRLLFLDIERGGQFAAVRQGKYKYFHAPLNDHAGICRFDVCLLYHGYYPCNQSAPYDTQLNDTVFLYDIISDPYETTNLANIDDPIYDGLIFKFQGLIEDMVFNGGYMEEQNTMRWPQSNPKYHNGTWAPWLL